MDKLNNPTLLQERESTDGSLITERDKTDESLESLRQKTERETDEKVKCDRQHADDARAQNRADTDTDIHPVIGEAGSDGFPNSGNEGQRAAEARLNERRQSDDEVVGTERLLMDKAIRKERSQKESFVIESLQDERAETNGNLLRERQRTDSEAQSRSELLVNEQSSHSVTKAALTSREELLAIVSHDLKNPIATIISFVNLMLHDSSIDQMGDEQRTWMEVIARNANISLRLITDILDMERFAEGKLELRLLPCNLQDLIQESAESFLPIAAAKNIVLQALPSNIPAVGICDRDRIAQAVSNLVGNALKFTPAGGSVTLKVQQTEKEVQVSVSDTGPGIPPEQQARIFERLAQIANKDRNGLGLGLYISKMLVEAHQGKLWVVSSPGMGSTFCFNLPKQGRATTAS